MKKKEYIQPQMEISAVQTEPMMQFINVSVKGSYTGGTPIGD